MFFSYAVVVSGIECIIFPVKKCVGLYQFWQEDMEEQLTSMQFDSLTWHAFCSSIENS